MSREPIIVVSEQEKEPGTVKYSGLAVSHVVAVMMYSANALGWISQVLDSGWDG